MDQNSFHHNKFNGMTYIPGPTWFLFIHMFVLQTNMVNVLFTKLFFCVNNRFYMIGVALKLKMPPKGYFLTNAVHMIPNIPSNLYCAKIWCILLEQWSSGPWISFTISTELKSGFPFTLLHKVDNLTASNIILYHIQYFTILCCTAQSMLLAWIMFTLNNTLFGNTLNTLQYYMHYTNLYSTLVCTIMHSIQNRPANYKGP